MHHLVASIFLLFIGGSIVTSILIITIPNTYGQNAPSAMITTQTDPSCKDLYGGPNLWSHVYGHPRLINPKGWTSKTDCITVTGTVLSISKPGTPGADPDGDYHFNILTDPNIPNYSNSANCKTQPPPGQQCRELIVEIICFDHSTITLPAAKASCANYKNSTFGPKVNDHVTIAGKWVEDFGVA